MYVTHTQDALIRSALDAHGIKHVTSLSCALGNVIVVDCTSMCACWVGNEQQAYDDTRRMLNTALQTYPEDIRYRVRWSARTDEWLLIEVLDLALE